MKPAALILVLWPAIAGAEQAATAGSLRDQLSALSMQTQALRSDMPGAEAEGFVGAQAPLARLNGIEAELRRLISLAEELEYRADQQKAHLDVLESRLCALDPNCDPPQQTATVTKPVPQTAPDAFAVAQDAFDAGNYNAAAQGFAEYQEMWPRGAHMVESYILRGQSLHELGDDTGAARAYLSAFSYDRKGPHAAQALFALGRELGHLGQMIEACVILHEVTARFPQSQMAADAVAEREALGVCDPA